MRNITTIRRKIVSMRKKKVHWVKICEALNIFDAHGNWDTGLAYKIANGLKDGRPYEPTELEVRRRLGLSTICKTCKRSIHVKKSKSEPRDEPAYMKWWRGISPESRNQLIKEMYLRS